jgi:probable DNA metabolism protein
MTVFLYDKTFDGLLTALFDAYSRRTFPDQLLQVGDPLPLFAEETYTVYTQDDKSTRVWVALEKKLSVYACRMIRAVWLSEEPHADMLLFRYIRKSIDSQRSIEADFADEEVLAVYDLAKCVYREAEHVKQFVRFQKTVDNLYFAPIAPKYNALPLAVEYFHSRFSDQEWMVFDTLRKYGYHYDLKTVEPFTFDEESPALLTGKLLPEQMAENEVMFQDFWKSYIRTLTIRERLNPKLQRQHMPVRFWRFLTEKQS